MAPVAPGACSLPHPLLLHSSTWHGLHFPPPRRWHPSLHTGSPLSAPLPPARCSLPRGGSRMLFYTLLLQALHVQPRTCLETRSTAGAPPCPIERMNKDAERMHVTVSALKESVSVSLSLGNLQHLLPQLASKRHGQSERRYRLSLVPCISASLYQKQRGEFSQGPSSHFTVLLSYPNIIHCQSCFSWQDKPLPPLP